MTTESRVKNGPERTAPQLGSCWSFSESYQSTAQKSAANYHQSNQIIFEISSVEKLALLWKHTDYARPSNLFYDNINHNIRKFRVSEADEEEKALEGMLLFRKGVKPEWEDPANKNGCSFDYTLKDPAPEQIDQIWQSLLLGLAGENFPFVQYITGIRYMDRLKKHNSIKLEIWLSISGEGPKKGSEEFFRNHHIIDSILHHYLDILNKSVSVTPHELTKNEHKIKLKVN